MSGFDPNFHFALYKRQNWIWIQNDSFSNSEAQFHVELQRSQKSNPGPWVGKPLEVILAQLEPARELKNQRGFLGTSVSFTGWLVLKLLQSLFWISSLKDVTWKWGIQPMGLAKGFGDCSDLWEDENQWQSKKTKKGQKWKGERKMVTVRDS